MVVFKNPRDASQLANLARQMYPGRGAFVQEAFADATASPYGYLLIDLKQNTPDDLRLRTSILPAMHISAYQSCVERCEYTITGECQ